jgi:hypothetical protein
MKRLEVFFLDYEEFNELVRTHFPERSDYNFVEAQEANDGTCYLCEHIGEPLRYKENIPTEKIEEWRVLELKRFQDWLEKKPYTGVGRHQIFEALFRKGVVKAGSYLIECSW